jgi:hypothetical protein
MASQAELLLQYQHSERHRLRCPAESGPLWPEPACEDMPTALRPQVDYRQPASTREELHDVGFGSFASILAYQGYVRSQERPFSGHTGRSALC